MAALTVIFFIVVAVAIDDSRGKTPVNPREMVLNSIFRDVKYAPQPSPSKLPIPLHCGKSKYRSNHASFYGSHFSMGKRLAEQDENVVEGIQKRIVGGKISESGEWPWLVSMQLLMNGTTYEHLCGGSLIHPQWVVSAAHCYEDFWASYLTSNPESWKVRVGEHFMFEDDETQEEIDVEKIFFHPGRNPKISTSNDIALVKLVRPVQLNENINVLCLPTTNDDFPPGTPCLTAGWGHSVEGGVVSAVVQHVQIPILPSDLCQEMYNKIPDKITVSIIDSMICAGLETGGKDACQYDSGGPLVRYDRRDHKWILIGIVSTGYGCARPGFPGIYTKVVSFLPWIESTVADY